MKNRIRKPESSIQRFFDGSNINLAIRCACARPELFACGIEDDHGGMTGNAVSLQGHPAIRLVHIQFLKGDTITILSL